METHKEPGRGQRQPCPQHNNALQWTPGLTLSEAEGAVDSQVDVALVGVVSSFDVAGPLGEPDVGAHAERLTRGGRLNIALN